MKQSTLLELLIEFATPQAVSADPQGTEKLMRSVGGHTLEEEKIRAVIDSAHDSIGVVATETQKKQIRYVAGKLREAQKRVRAVERRIEQVAKQDRATRSLADFAGARMAVVLVGRINCRRSIFRRSRGSGRERSQRAVDGAVGGAVEFSRLSHRPAGGSQS